MVAYADWSFYTSVYNGQSIAQTSFDNLIKRASAEIDKVTYDQAAEVIETDEDETTIEKIKLATCAIAEMLQIYDEGGIVASESVGSHSRSYVQDKGVVSKSNAIRLTAKTYLAFTDLMQAAVE